MVSHSRIGTTSPSVMARPNGRQPANRSAVALTDHLRAAFESIAEKNQGPVARVARCAAAERVERKPLPGIRRTEHSPAEFPREALHQAAKQVADKIRRAG